MRRCVTTVLLAICALTATASPARADGDPASDTLLYGDAFYPYQPNLVSKPLQRALDGMLKATKKQGYHLQVAIIASEADLGAYPQLLTDPQKYANLLQTEITFNNKPRILAVLPAGLGGNNLGDKAAAALAGIAPPEDSDGDALTRTAIQAVARLAQANGTPVATPVVTAAPKREKSGGASPVLTFGLPAGLVALAALAAALRGRSRSDDDERQDQDGEASAQ